MDKTYLLAGLNFIACCVIFFVTVCRLNAITHRTLYRVRWEYTLFNLAAITSAFSPWFGEWPDYTRLVTDIAILSYLFASAHAWHTPHGDTSPPKTDRMPLS